MCASIWYHLPPLALGRGARLALIVGSVPPGVPPVPSRNPVRSTHLGAKVVQNQGSQLSVGALSGARYCDPLLR
eukprot:scaffold9353_cov31-Tisochrysis_lutea.AAC.3